jgi:sugar phosphate isomerase/epimerase
MMPTRREFLKGAASAAVLMLSRRLPAADAAPGKLFSQVGIMAPFERGAELQASGVDYILESCVRLLVPDKPESEFARLRDNALAAALPIGGCNFFLRDPKLRSIGPDADHPRVLAYADTAFRRVREVGGDYIVFGSCTSRRLPPGWPREKADEQFIALLRALGPLAARHNVMLAVEQLNRGECNYINHLHELVAVLSAVDHPQVRGLADLFHMARMDETPEDLARALPWIAILEIAEKETRSIPGTAGDDFRPYFAALAAGGFSGRIAIESAGAFDADAVRRGLATIARQAGDAMRTVKH